MVTKIIFQQDKSIITHLYKAITLQIIQQFVDVIIFILKHFDVFLQ